MSGGSWTNVVQSMVCRTVQTAVPAVKLLCRHHLQPVHVHVSVGLPVKKQALARPFTASTGQACFSDCIAFSCRRVLKSFVFPFAQRWCRNRILARGVNTPTLDEHTCYMWSVAVSHADKSFAFHSSKACPLRRLILRVSTQKEVKNLVLRTTASSAGSSCSFSGGFRQLLSRL